MTGSLERIAPRRGSPLRTIDNQSHVNQYLDEAPGQQGGEQPHWSAADQRHGESPNDQKQTVHGGGLGGGGGGEFRASSHLPAAPKSAHEMQKRAKYCHHRAVRAHRGPPSGEVHSCECEAGSPTLTE